MGGAKAYGGRELCHRTRPLEQFLDPSQKAPACSVLDFRAGETEQRHKDSVSRAGHLPCCSFVDFKMGHKAIWLRSSQAQKRPENAGLLMLLFGRDFYQTYVRTRVWCGCFLGPFRPETLKTKQKSLRRAIFLGARVLHASVQNGTFLCMFACFLRFFVRFCASYPAKMACRKARNCA